MANLCIKTQVLLVLIFQLLVLRPRPSVPPFPLRIFGQDDFPSKGEGTSNSAEEYFLKKQEILVQNCLAFFRTFLALFELLNGLWSIFNLFNTG